MDGEGVDNATMVVRVRREGSLSEKDWGRRDSRRDEAECDDLDDRFSLQGVQEEKGDGKT